MFFVSFYTKKTGYEQEVKNLIFSLEVWGLNYKIGRIDSLGSWQKNTHYKAKFIRKMLDYCNTPIVWVDADAVIKDRPVLFETLKADFACHLRGGSELLSGTLYFANNDTVKSFVDDWIATNEKHPDVWEQKNLQAVLPKWKDKINIFYLPPEYCLIFDLMRKEGEPVIEHYQASRRFKEKI